MLWVCDDCTTAYSVGAPRCPHCGSEDFHEQGEPMPKITRARGASNALADPPAGDTEPAEEAVEEPAAKKTTKKTTRKS